MTLVHRQHHEAFAAFSRALCDNPAKSNGKHRQTSSPLKQMVSIKFSEPWKPNTPVPKKELELSAQRSHSAIVAHARRKKQHQQQKAEREGEKFPSSCTLLCVAALICANDHSAEPSKPSNENKRTPKHASQLELGTR